MTKNLRITIKTTLSITQYHNQTSKPKNNKKTVLKSRMWTKNFARLEKIFSHINLSLSQKQRYEQKPLSFRSTLQFCSAQKPLQIFSRVSFPALKITPIKLIKKKKDFSNTPLRVVKRQRPNTIQILWIVKKTAPQYNSNSLNCKK